VTGEENFTTIEPLGQDDPGGFHILSRTKRVDKRGPVGF
jgi:hypothetical protein